MAWPAPSGWDHTAEPVMIHVACDDPFSLSWPHGLPSPLGPGTPVRPAHLPAWSAITCHPMGILYDSNTWLVTYARLVTCVICTWLLWQRPSLCLPLLSSPSCSACARDRAFACFGL